MQEGSYLFCTVKDKAILSILYKKKVSHHVVGVAADGGLTLNEKATTARTHAGLITFLNTAPKWWPVGPLSHGIQPEEK